MTAATLKHEYLSTSDLSSRPADWWDTVLGLVGFDHPPSGPLPDVPSTASMTPALGAARGCLEVWRLAPAPGGSPANSRGTGPVKQSGVRGAVHYRVIGELLFGCVKLDEQPTAGEAAASGLTKAASTAYRDVFALLDALDHRHLVRVWNYLPRINADADGEERYRHFNSARRAAFAAAQRGVVGSVPAASALGSQPGSPLSIYFLASTRAPIPIENPRQTSAYFYPPTYGRHSPIFSRACLLSGAAGSTLFVSGTASIVGYDSVHGGDACAQTRETLANIDSLLTVANGRGPARYTLDRLKLKVYVRNEADLPGIAGTLESVVRPIVPPLFLKADVCRHELLMEIEAIGETTTAPRSSE